jgi:transposase-like protein
MQTQPQWCDQRACPDFGKIGGSNLKVYSDAERRSYCTTCSHPFNADRGTLFETVRTDRQVILHVVAMVVERNSLRAICRIKRCQLDTVLHWLDLAGQQAAAVSRRLITSLHLTQAQIDELWTLIKKHRNTFKRVISTI